MKTYMKLSSSIPIYEFTICLGGKFQFTICLWMNSWPWTHFMTHEIRYEFQVCVYEESWILGNHTWIQGAAPRFQISAKYPTTHFPSRTQTQNMTVVLHCCWPYFTTGFAAVTNWNSHRIFCRYLSMLHFPWQQTKELYTWSTVYCLLVQSLSNQEAPSLDLVKETTQHTCACCNLN